eukprot:5746348-Prymnesium_polylepis.1
MSAHHGRCIAGRCSCGPRAREPERQPDTVGVATSPPGPARPAARARGELARGGRAGGGREAV